MQNYRKWQAIRAYVTRLPPVLVRLCTDLVSISLIFVAGLNGCLSPTPKKMETTAERNLM